MSEDVTSLLWERNDLPWRISRRDAEMLREVQEVMRWWLPALSATDDLVAAVRAIQTIEAIVADGQAPTSITEFTVSRVDQLDGGRSACIIVGPKEVHLSCFEWAPNVNGTLDCHTMTSLDGRPISMGLDRDGSYSRDDFERWYFEALDSGPLEIRDQIARGKISAQD